MKYLSRLLLVFIVLGFFGIGKVYASHAMGADITYRCLGNGQYEITLKFYRDCDGVSAPSSALISAVSGCTGQTVSATLTRDPVFSFLEVTPLCPPLRDCSECNPNPPSNCPQPLYPGVELYTYRGTITLPSQCASWNLSWTHCCRNSAITNLASPGSASMYLNITINNANGLCNNSPVFSELPTPYICNNQLYNYNHGVYDADGDSVVYELIPPMNTGGASIGYVNPFSLTNPMATTQFAFDRFTGQLSLVPNQTQQAVLTFRVKEYRNGVLIGETIRDIQVVVINCNSNQIPPTLSGYTNPGGGGYIIDTFTMGVCPGNQITFDIFGSDGNALDSVYLSTNFDSVFSGGTYSIMGSQNPNSASFSWTPGASDVGTHYFVVTARDNHCPTTSSATQAYAIKVLEEVKASPDQKFCNVGGPIRLEAQGGSLFHWRPTNTIVAASQDSSWIEVSPTQTTTYTVTSDCNKSDSVTVEIVPSFTYTLSPDDTICRFDFANMEVTADQSFAPYQISWSPDYRLDTNGVFAVEAQPFTSTTYTIELISKDGCRVVDSVQINVDGEKPRITVTPDKNYLCRDDSDQVQMDILAAPAECGPSAQGCGGSTSITTQIGVGTDLSSIVTPFYGSYKNYRMQILYKKEDLQNLGLLGGTISELAFNVGQKLTTSAIPGFSVSMGCTELESLPFEFQDGLTTVFGPSGFSTTNGWTSIPLTTEYDWDGFSNLIIEICFTGNSNFGNDWIEYTKTGFTSVIYRFDDFAGPGCDLTPSLTSDLRPNMQLKVCSQPLTNVSFSWNPTNGVSDPTIADPIVSGLTETTDFTVIADYNGCIGSSQQTIYVDSTRVLASPDTLLCDTGQVQLVATAIGTPPPIKLSCGANGTPVVTPENDYPIGNGSQSFNGTLFQNGLTDMKFQMLLRSSDLIAEGIRAGIITELSIELATKASTAPAENFEISMGCTLEDRLTSNAFEPVSSVVYSSSAYSTVMGMNTFTLSSPFDWDGQSNIVIQVCWDNDQNYIGGTDNLKVYDVNYNAMIRAYGNDSVGCNLVKPKSPYQKLPNVILKMAAPPPGNFEYLWTQLTNGSNTLSSDTVQNPLAAPNDGETLYQVQIETEFGCIVFDTVAVNRNVLDVTTANDTAICKGNTANLFATGGDTYEWNPINDLVTPDSSFTLANSEVTTTYTVTIYNTAGCVVEREVTVIVNDTPTVDAGPAQSILIGEVVNMNATGGTDFSWQPPTGLSDPNISDPTASPTTTTTYTVEVTDTNGCVNTDTVTVAVSSIDDVFIPTAFSPNGDGVNDVWHVVPLGLAEIERLEIYNRWGNMVFSANSMSDGWNGTVNGEPQPADTYVYILIGYDYKGDQIIKRGNITLLR